MRRPITQCFLLLCALYGGIASAQCVDGELSLRTDNYGSETAWQLRDSAGGVFASGSGYASNQTFTEDFCLDPGSYEFIITDSYGDGICCGYGQGSYAVEVDGIEVASGGDFGSQEITPFDVAGGSSGACSQTAGSLSLNTDNYGGETSWDVRTGGGSLVASGSAYASNQSYEEPLCLTDGDYQFTIYDSYGDGICCGYGQGSYSLVVAGSQVASGGSFGSQESAGFSVGGSGPGGGADLGGYYADADGLSGYALKTALHEIIESHTSQGYGALWGFYGSYERDDYYEHDGSLLDIYSENPAGSDPYVYTSTGQQCGSYNSEADCYNREHSFPRSWFGGAVEPMNSDVHHIFASDGYVNAQRGSYPYGEVGSATFTSQNGSRKGSAAAALGYSGTVFEPIDAFKGDLARAYFYMATRYEDRIAGWQGNSGEADAVLDGSANQVFEGWFLEMLKSWHQQDPVSQKEIDRNDAAWTYQGNRNPFVDHPELVGLIWGN